VRSALTGYATALRRAAAGAPVRLHLVAAGRPVRVLDPARWCALRPGDTGVVDRCAGPSLDVGCGPGRFTAALAARGLPAVGIDICPEAVRQTRRRGAVAHRLDVFSPSVERLRTGHRRGAWRHVLLTDGNIGIGGDPARLLRRCARLLAPGGDILVEVDPPGSGSWSGPVALVGEDGASAPFAWAAVDAAGVDALADAAALVVLEHWTEARRWFVRVGHG
jgi:SAM-dependent methyltransferase